MYKTKSLHDRHCFHAARTAATLPRVAQGLGTLAGRLGPIAEPTTERAGLPGRVSEPGQVVGTDHQKEGRRDQAAVLEALGTQE